MKHTTVSGLKARLSAYLAEVRNGETVIVCDRKTPIARLSPLEEAPDDFRVEEPQGPVPHRKALPKIRLRRRVDVVALLRADRDQR
jgi:antitoxin (DNA-binding transcriptional repressor) of toxin-antitoxin stability system